MYTGFRITQSKDCIKIDQNQYVNCLEIPEIDRSHLTDKKSPLVDAEKTMLRKMTGALNW